MQKDKENPITQLPTPFPSQEEALAQLKRRPEAYVQFCNLSEEQQNNFLDFCAGRTSIYLCYDRFFKHIFDAYNHRDWVEGLLSALLGQNIKILEVLPREGTKVHDKDHLVVMDLVIRLQDDSIINLEMQKIGYYFPAQRLDCYNADLIMRDYSFKREKYKKEFRYNMLSPVVSIALVENSTSSFKQFGGTYIHHAHMQWDSSIEPGNLTREIYVALDIFREVMQNKDIDTPLEAWLTLLSTQDMSRIEELILKFPEFAGIYREIFEFRTRPEELINMYVGSFAEADHATELYMIESMNAEINELTTQKKELSAQNEELSAQNEELSAQNEELSAQNEELSAQNEQDKQAIAALMEEIRQLKGTNQL